MTPTRSVFAVILTIVAHSLWADEPPPLALRHEAHIRHLVERLPPVDSGISEIPGRGADRIAVSSDSRLLAFASNGFAVWQIAGPHKLFSSQEHRAFDPMMNNLAETRVVSGVAFASNDHWLVTSGHDGNIIVWDAHTGRKIRVMGERLVSKSGYYPVPWMRVPILSMAVSPDGRAVATAVGRTIRIWDLESGKRVKSLGKELVTEDVNLLGNTTVPLPEFLTLLNVPEEEGQATNSIVRRVVSGTKNEVREVAFSPDGKLLIGTGGDVQGAFVISLETGEVARSWPGQSLLVMSPDGKLIAMRSGQNALGIFDFESHKLLQSFSFDAAIRKVCFTPDSRAIVFADVGQILVGEIASGKIAATYPGKPIGDVRDFALSSDGQWLFATWRHWDEKRIRQWKLPRSDASH